MQEYEILRSVCVTGLTAGLGTIVLLNLGTYLATDFALTLGKMSPEFFARKLDKMPLREYVFVGAGMHQALEQYQNEVIFFK